MVGRTFPAAVVLFVATIPALAARGATTPDELVIADFNSGQKPDNLGGDFGAWIKDPSDPMQGALDSFDRVNRYGGKGYALRLVYNVASQRPAFGGLWFKVNGLDASSYANLALRVKGDAAMGYSSTFKLEIKDALGQVSQYRVTGISDKWQDMVVPFDRFESMANRRRLSEVTIVLEDTTATAKQGVLYFDDLRLTGGKR